MPKPREKMRFPKTNWPGGSPTPRFSVIVPMYQAEATLPLCLAGLDAQTMPQESFEVLFIDNNSTDNSTNIVLRHERAQLLQEVEQGAYAARNRALRRACGDVFVFTDPDCIPDPDWLAGIDAVFKDPNVMIVVGAADATGSSVAVDLMSKYERQKDAFVLSSKSPEIYYGHTNNMAVRRSVFQVLGPFLALKRGSDTIFTRRAVDHFGCGSLIYDPQIRVRHLEVDSISSYFKKVKTYSASCQRYRRIVHVRPLSTTERLCIFRKVVRDENLSSSRTLYLLILLMIGMISWHAGTLLMRNKNLEESSENGT